MKLLTLGTLAISLLLLAPAVSTAQVKVSGAQQLSVGLNGQPPQGTSGAPVVAQNGRFLAFRSDAPNLIANDSNGNNSDIFIRDLTTGALSLASVSSSQIQGDDDSNSPAISPIGPDGWYTVAFSSTAKNLSSISNPNSRRNIFLRFPTLGITLPVTFGAGAISGDDDSDSPSVAIKSAPNTAYVTYSSDAENLVTDDSNNNRDVFLSIVKSPSSATQDPTQLVTTKLISRRSSVVPSNDNSDEPQISGDGRFVVFSSRATNLIAGRTTSHTQIFLYTVATGTLSLLSQTSGGIEGSGNSTSPVISYSGRYVAFLTRSQNLLSGISNKTALVLLDRNTGILQRVNAKSDGTPGTGDAKQPSISANGRFVSFSDSSDDLVPNDGNGMIDVFVKDTTTGAIALTSNPIANTADGDSDTSCTAGASYNALQGFISFRSFADNLATNPTIGGGEVFLTTTSYVSPTLTKKTRLETPADVRVRGKRVNVATQKFTLATSSAGELSPRAAKRQVKFDVRIEGTGARKNDRFQLISARNTVSRRNLRPGVYTTRYRAITQSNNKTVAATPFSPRQRF